jgi:hypothetical protein
MNALTRRIVTEVAKKNKAAAERNDREFQMLVEAAWWTHVLLEHGVTLQSRALRLWQQFHPEQFSDGYLCDYDPWVYDVELAISDIVGRAMQRIVDRNPELQLTAYGDWPAECLKPKLTDLPLFAALEMQP